MDSSPVARDSAATLVLPVVAFANGACPRAARSVRDAISGREDVGS